MLPTKISSIVALVVAIVAICLVSYHPVEATRAFISVRNLHTIQSTAFVSVRGGATTVEEEEELEIESSDYDESEEEEEEDDPKLAKSTQKAISKVAKKAVTSTLESTKPVAKKTKNSSLLKLFKIPYIVGACLNPIVLVKMIKGYWASLVNLEYLKENVVSSGLFLCVPFFCHLCFG